MSGHDGLSEYVGSRSRPSFETERYGLDARRVDLRQILALASGNFWEISGGPV